MQIITLGNEILNKKALRIEKINEETANLARQMLEILKRDNGIGLAGSQVGILKRIFVIHVQGDEERVFINPSILETSHSTSKYEEGCLSVPGIYAEVVRSECVKIQAWNEKGRPFTLETGGLLARVILHEYDHLDGILFLDHLPEIKKQKYIEKYEKTKKGENSKK